MKRLLSICLLAWAFSCALCAQNEIPATQSFTIEGAVQQPLTITVAQLLAQPQVKLKPV